ncbi:50S ribosomal protein L21 [Myxococcota bacterium]|nr:50S ribosomal protein L21 [Myxococcota bacterium]
MYAVLSQGGKQYKVVEGDVIRFDRMDGAVGDAVQFDQVLLVGGTEVQVGRPVVDGARVSGEIVAQGKDRKVLIFKLRRRKNYHRKRGFRRQYTGVRITGIQV